MKLFYGICQNGLRHVLKSKNPTKENRALNAYHKARIYRACLNAVVSCKVTTFS